MIALVLSGLVCGRGRHPMTRPLDLILRPGEALVVTGPNGVGKSTLLRTLAGHLPPLAGRTRIEGARAVDGEPARRIADAAHYFGHRNAMKPGRTVGEELRFWSRFLGRPALGAQEALTGVGLGDAEDLPVGALSAGQQRRAAFARLLVSDRPVWLLDEPTTALDDASRTQIAGLCRDRLATGGIVVAATHQVLDIPGARSLALAPLEAVPGDAAPGADPWDEIA